MTIIPLKWMRSEVMRAKRAYGKVWMSFGSGQTDDDRLSLFVTHGGIASTNEVAFMGKPAIVVPIFGDQMRNAHMLVRHGGALMLHKFDIADSQKLIGSIEAVLNDASFAERAKRLSRMLRNQPVSAHELLLKHAEFAARFGRLQNLDPYGRQLPLLQYYLVDVFAAIAGVVLISVTILVLLVRRICCRSQRKAKAE
ncbi:hypothetical protein Y032_0040g231 [Ancylostoma ceylanicum]|nr:hypothetical protein Y032_0040g231 [Ancylostoma ceylanicum]